MERARSSDEGPRPSRASRRLRPTRSTLARPTTPSLVVAVRVLVLGAVATIALTQWEPGGPSGPLPTVDDTDEPSDWPEPGADDGPVALVDDGGTATTRTDHDLTTTVAWPLEVRLDLLEDRSLPPVPAGPPLGSGRTAELAGRIADADGRPVRATVRFVEGVNAGRALFADGLGRFGATDLVPGMAIVEVSGPDILGSRREVRLRSGVETLLNIGYGRPGTVQGQVVDESGEGVADALVRLDGLEQRTGEDGTFYFVEVAAGRCLLEIEKEGFVDQRTLLGVAGGFVVEPGTLKFALRRPASLVIRMRPNIGGPEPALAYLMPAASARERAFPWHRVNPIELPGEGSITVHDLPEGAVHLRVYRTGAVAVPEYRQVYLSAGNEAEVEVRLEPAPVVVGAVFMPDGNAAEGATVRITAADVASASRRHFPSSDQLWLEHVLPLMPSVDQTVVTDASGRFRTTSWADLSPFRLLEARSADGSASLRTLIGPEHDDRPLELHLVEGADDEVGAVFSVVMPGRTQALPVTVTVDGAPRETVVIGAEEDLVIEGLTPGVYRLEAKWQRERVAYDTGLVVVGEARSVWQLPADAIEGQSPAEWLKLGRPYPRELPPGGTGGASADGASGPGGE